MMRLPYFRYHAPTSVREAVERLAASPGDSMVVAGGTDLLPNMKRRQQCPSVLIGLRRIEELKRMSNGDGLTIGAGVTLTTLLRHQQLRETHPGLWQAASHISTPHLRNMGTVGGNLCLDTRCNYYDQNYEWRKAIHFCMKKDGEICWVAPSSPRCWAVQSSDCAPVMVAIGAKVKLVSSSGERVISAAELYNDDGIRHLNKRPDELLSEIYLPPVNGWRATYWKLRRRGSFDFPVLGVATSLKFSADGTVEDSKIILGGVGSHPVEAVAAQKIIAGKKLTEDVIREAAQAAYQPAKPLDNTDFAMTWRKEMARFYVSSTLRELAT
jgi:4-hydroxybenzoyl-CoA reductase subunit beta